MQDNKKVCCLIGTPPEDFLWDYSEKNLIEKKYYDIDRFIEIEKLIWHGYGYFICGCERGADMDFAEDIIYFRTKAYPDVKLEIVLRYPEQAEEYGETEKLRYQEIVSKADKVTVLATRSFQNGVKKKTRYLIDNAEKGLAVWNFKQKGESYQAILYAQKQKKELEFLSLLLCVKETRERTAMLMRYAETHFMDKKNTTGE